MNGDQEPWIVGDQERRTLWSRGCVSRTPVSTSVSACVCTVWTRDTIMMIVTRSHWLGQGFGLKTQRKRVRNTIRMSHGHPHVVLYVLGCTRAALMYSTRADTQMVELVVALDTRSGGILCFVYTMVIKTELWTRVHSPVVRAADCRSAGPWFNSGWRHWIHIHWHVQRNNITSPITTTITMPMTTIPRESVNI